MSVAKDMKQQIQDAKRAGKGRRGSQNSARRLDAFKTSAKEGSAEWSTCDSLLLLEVVDTITGLGGAITLGLSRDQGAHSLTLLLDSARTTLWFNGDADLDEKLREVLVTLQDM
jgi:hypothetical protein